MEQDDNRLVVNDELCYIEDLEEYKEKLDEFEELYKDIMTHYEYVIKIMIKKYNLNYSEYEDIMQEGRVAIFKACLSFIPNKGTKFESYVSLCIERRILSLIRDKNRKKRKVNYNVSLDSARGFSLHEKLDSKVNVEEEVINSIHYQTIFDQVIKDLDPLEAKIFSHYVEGYSISELCEKYHVPKKKLYVIVAKARNKIDAKLSKC